MRRRPHFTCAPEVSLSVQAEHDVSGGHLPCLFPGRTVERPAMPSMSRREQSWLWLIFAGSILGSAYLHELGHCLPAWVQGYPAIHTPAKEYILAAVTDPVQRAIALGGVLGSVLAFLGALWLYFKSPRVYSGTTKPSLRHFRASSEEAAAPCRLSRETPFPESGTACPVAGPNGRIVQVSRPKTPLTTRLHRLRRYRKQHDSM